LALGAVLALAGFGVVTLMLSMGPLRRADAPRKQELISLINARKHEVDQLEAAVSDLRSQLDRAQTEAGRRTQSARAQAAETERLSLEAATTAVSGPAVSVRLADSDRQPADLAQASSYRIHDVDLQLVVNALFAAGAEGVAVNGARVAVTTPIRAAGQTIVVNFRPLTPPYVVTAVGADRVRFEASDVAKRFRGWVGAFGLGFSVRTANKLTLPAYVGRLAIVTATPTLTPLLPGPEGPTTTEAGGPTTTAAGGPTTTAAGSP
jgi:uncharacterized protein YlxW (UPF0749 family)